MDENNPFRRGKEFFERKDYAQAVREFKKAISVEKANPDGYVHLAKTYIKIADSENLQSFYLLAENAMRKAIKREARNQDFHDILIGIKAKSGTLDQLSREYRRKADEQEDGKMYRDLLKKVSAIGFISIPDRKPIYKSRSKIIIFLNYVIMPLIVAFTVVAWVLPNLKFIRLPSLIIVAGYLFIKISGRPRPKKDRW